MTQAKPMTHDEAMVALLPLQKTHDTLKGARVGFFMSDATDVLGGNLSASNMLIVMHAQGLVDCELVLLSEDDDARMLYRVVGGLPPTFH